MRTVVLLAALVAVFIGLRRQMMAVSAQVQAFSDRINAATNEIASDLAKLREAVAAGRPLNAEEAALLETNIARLEQTGVDPENPV